MYTDLAEGNAGVHVMLGRPATQLLYLLLAVLARTRYAAVVHGRHITA